MDQNNLNDFDPTDTYDHYDAIFQPDYDRYMRDYESYQHYVGLCEQEVGGSSNGPKRRRTYIYREREEAEQRLIDDYFGDDEYEPKYPEEKFRLRSRLDATGRKSIGHILKCTSVIRQMAYDTSPDAFDEYLQIAEQAVVDQKLWIWHAYFGVPGANNDLNMLYGSPLFDDEIADIAPECPFVVNGHTYRKGMKKTLKFKRVQEAARKDIERAFGVLQAPNIVRDWVERCDLHVRKTKELRNRKTHIDLRQDIMEHLWNNDDE
ncbi:hypothetical protein Tco_0144190 [Tanacetum coccineum]